MFRFFDKIIKNFDNQIIQRAAIGFGQFLECMLERVVYAYRCLFYFVYPAWHNKSITQSNHLTILHSGYIVVI
jgi:hypothetical protein